jgi:hypothetical protein
VLLAGLVATARAAEREPPEVAGWWTAAENGDLNARWQLILRACNYVAHDYVEAARILEVNARQGDGNSADLLALLYRTGEGVPKNYPESVRWLKIAVQQGNIYAQHHLAMRYEAGEGVPANNAEAYFWYVVSSALQINDGFRALTIKRRDQIEKKLTNDAVNEAQKQGKKWVEEILGLATAH